MEQIKRCSPEDSQYPKILKNAGRTKILYYRGNIEIVNQYQNLAIIGSRKFSEKGRKFAYWTGKKAATAGLNVVNGLALGCDAEALRGAIAGGGKCIAILPCGLDQIVPKSNSELAESILEQGGCLISEYEEGVQPEKYRYIERDRLQSEISNGIVVIEAEEKSGTMHTAEFALKMQRRLACYYYALVENATGNRKLGMTGKSDVLKKEEDVETFLQKIQQEEKYEQLKLDFPLY